MKEYKRYIPENEDECQTLDCKKCYYLIRIYDVPLRPTCVATFGDK